MVVAAPDVLSLEKIKRPATQKKINKKNDIFSAVYFEIFFEAKDLEV